MRAIFINAKDQTITDIDFSGDYKAICRDAERRAAQVAVTWN